MRIKNKLSVVTRHEFLTIVRQPSFWIALIALPLVIAVIIAVGYFTDSSRNTNIDSSANELNVAMVDESGLILPETSEVLGVTESAEPQPQLIEQVKTGQLQGLIIYPSDLEQSGKYQVYADNTNDNNAAIVQEMAKRIMQESLLAPLESKELALLAITGGETQTTSYTNGEPNRDFAEYVIPGSFLVIFYIVLVFSVGYALTSVSEEKENRSIEMVLSYVKPQTLILGKLLGVILVTLVQILFFALLGGVGYLVARALGNDLSLPFSLSSLTTEPMAVFFGIAFLIFGFVFYVCLMATIGALFPSTKEASGFSTVFYFLPAVPFWGFNAIVHEPSSTFTQLVTNFPLTSPTASLLRNAAGNLGVVEGLISLAILIAATILTILLAGKAFRLGTLEFNSRIKLTDLFK